MQQDSLVVHKQAATALSDTLARQPSRPKTPYQVLRMLPKDATPAQQDSAIQAWFEPAEIRYSSRPDTLHLPGHSVGRSIKDVDLPQYYRESYFSNDSLLHPELSGGRYGVAGDPVPYTVRSDNFFTSMLLGCFILTIVAYANSRRFIARQFKALFYPTHSDEGFSLSETSVEVRFQLLLLLQSCLLLAIMYYFYTTTYVAETFVLDSDYQLIGIFFAVFLGYFIAKTVVSTFVNGVFFDLKRNVQWLHSILFFTAFEGVALLPIVLLQVYFGLSIQKAVYYLIFVMVLVKLVAIYRGFVIFFKKNSAVLQFFLYFCALEIAPILAIWGCLVMIVDELKINF